MFGKRAAIQTASSKYGSARWWIDELQFGEVARRPLEVVRSHRLEVHQPERDPLVELDHVTPSSRQRSYSGYASSRSSQLQERST